MSLSTSSCRTSATRRLASAAVAGVLAVPMAFAAQSAGAAPLGTDEVTARPVSGTLTVSGRGYGHGRGMSQWGAYGAADAGLGWSQILDFYYPGTTRDSVGNSTLRVWLSADTDGDTQVLAAPGLAVTVGNTRRVLPTGPAYAAWRAIPSAGASGTVALQFRGASGGWKAYSFGGGAAATFSTTSGIVRVLMPGGGSKDVRGTVMAVAEAGAPRGLRTVLASTMQSYLRSVVPGEMPSSWHTEALTAQSVAARTYAASYRDRQRAKGATWDICDTVTCQVFKGVNTYDAAGKRYPGEQARTDAAIERSAGVVLRTAAGNFALTEFSASNGGWTVAGGPSYQVAAADPYDGRMKNTNTAWTAPVTVRAVEKAYGVGTLRSVRVTRLDGNGAMQGRVLRMDIVGTTATRTVTGADFRAKLGLKSDWFTLGGTSAPAPISQAPGVTTRPPTATATASDRRSLLTTDARGLLWMRQASGLGFTGGTRIGNSWNSMNALLSVGNWDGRGGDDLVARQKSSGRLLLYTGDGTGALRGPRTLTGNVAHLTQLSSTGDLDGDGRADIAAIDTRTGTLVLLRGAAGGGVAGTVTLASPRGAVALFGAGDLDKDGNNDLGWIDASGRAHIMLGDGHGAFPRTVSMGRGWNQFSSIWAAGDVDGNGTGDVFALHRNGTLYRYDGTGRGSLGARSVVLSGLRPVLIAR